MIPRPALRGDRRPLVALGAIVLLVLIGTLTPAPESVEAAARTSWRCLACGSAGLADNVLNFVLLMPLGAALAVLRWDVLRASAAALVLAGAIEVLQGTVVPGRDAALGDVLANGIGATLGWAIAHHWRKIVRPEPRTAMWIVVAACALGAATGAAATRLFVPAMARADFTRVRFSPPSHGRPTFAGQVLSYRLNGASYRDREVPDSLPSSAVDLTVSFTWLNPGTGTATIARIDGTSGDAVTSLSVRNGMLRASVHTLASHWRLRSPPLTVPLPSPLRDGDTVTVHHVARGNDVSLTASTAGRRSHVSGTFRPWHGWALLNPFTGAVQFAASEWAWSALWMIGWGTLIAWYAYCWLDAPHAGRDESPEPLP